MSKLLAALEVTLMGRFLITVESLPSFDFPAAPGCLELLAPWFGLSELLASY
jgi:hypothetical protein